MAHRYLGKPYALAGTSIVLLLLFIVACGSAAQPAEPQVIEKEVIKEVQVKGDTEIVEKEVIKEVEKIVEKEVVVFATPVAGVYETEVPDWVSVGADHHYNGVIRFIHRANPGFLDLHYGASSTTVLLPSGPRFNQILAYDPTNPSQIIGDLAERWEVSDDGLLLTFHLADAKWQDGEQVTADDVVFSFDRMAQEGVTRGRVTAIRDFYTRGTARAVDDRTVEMPLNFPSATALGWLAVDYYKIYARHVVENTTQDDLNCCFESNVGSGPWKFKKWTKGDSWEMERYDEYFKNPIPFYDGFKVFVVEDAARRLASMKTGQVDAWLVMGGTSLKDMLQVQKETDGRMRAARSGAGSIRGFWLHWNKPPLDDPKVRKAIYLALDRGEIGDIAGEGEAIPGNFFPPGYATSAEDLAQLPGFRYKDGVKDPQDVEAAKQLMIDAGYPDGFDLTFNVDQAKDARSEAELIAAQLKETLNIEVVLQAQDRATFYANLRDGSHNLSVIGSGLYFLEPQTILVQFFAQDTLRNPHNWENPRFTELMQMETRELDQEKRLGYYQEMASILNEGEGHYIPLYWEGRAGAVDYRIQNFKPPYHPHTIWRWDQIWWDPDAEIPGGDAPPIQ